MTTAHGPVGPARPGGARSHKSSAVACFVWAVWALLTAAALGFVGWYGSALPFWDDWDLVPLLTENQPVTASWLWAQHNDHRMPLPKVVLLALGRLSGCDSRAGMVLNVLALAGLALALIRAGQRLRGRLSYADAFFPLLLLHWGQSENLLIGFTANLVLPTVLTGLLLAFMAQAPARSLTAGEGALAGACLVLLSLCGASGVAVVPALALWLGCAGLRAWRSAGPGGKQVWACLLAFAAVVLACVYWVGYRRPHYSYDPALMGLRDYVRTGVQFLSVGWGMAAAWLRPFLGVVTVGLLLASLAALFRAWLLRPGERPRAFGLACFLGAMLCVAVGVGWGRSTAGASAGFQSRFATLAAPALCGIYLTWELCGGPAGRRLARAGMFGLAGLLFGLNVYDGVQYGRNHRAQMQAFDRDLRDGVPTFLLLRRHAPFLFFSLSERLAEGMGMLQRAGVRPFTALAADPPFREVRLAVEPVWVRRLAWHGQMGQGTGKDPYALFALPAPRFVAGVRLTFSYPDAGTRPVYFQVFWGSAGAAGFRKERSYVNWVVERTSRDRSVTVWIGETLEYLRIHPDNEGAAFRIAEISLLVPEGDG